MFWLCVRHSFTPFTLPRPALYHKHTCENNSTTIFTKKNTDTSDSIRARNRKHKKGQKGGHLEVGTARANGHLKKKKCGHLDLIK